MSTQPHQRPRPSAMDPPHITEFASERYFEKLSQSHARQQAAAQASTSAAAQTQTQTQLHTLHLQPSSSTAPTTDHLDHGIPASSSFILPLRESKAATETITKPAEHKKDKSRFFGLRHKVSLLHSKPTSTPLVEPQVAAPEARVSIESTASSIPLDQLFLALPNELQLQIISSLPLTDVLNLRRTSKSWHALITLNEGPIVRYHLDQHIPAYARRLYPVDDKSRVDFHYLCSLWHRLHVASKLAFLMCEWITKDIFLRQTESQRLAFAHQHECMRRRLIPLLFTIFHFFETYRKLHLEYIRENDGVGLQQRPYTVNPIERQIMDMYDDRTLLRVHEVFPLVISSFCRQLRPPTYVGRVERSLRGYLREKPSDEVHAAILCLGGMRQVERLWEIKGYNSRRAAVDSWFNGLTKEAMEPLSPQQSAASAGGEPQRQASTKSRFKFGRKKSSSGAERPAHRGSFSEAISARVRSPFGSIDSTNGGYFDHNFVFHTSLAADAPMAPLEADAASTLLKDLPVLQQIWLTTAEALVLERGIVESPRDIKRNHHVMHHLIREDGICEEDEWWYGRGIPESVRPVVTAGECDDLA